MDHWSLHSGWDGLALGDHVRFTAGERVIAGHIEELRGGRAVIRSGDRRYHVPRDRIVGRPADTATRRPPP
ncbi:MAG: hypothetical protein ACYDDF_12500 [Thermoplasmatota archaeon]